MTIASVNMLKNEKSMSKTQSRNSMAKSHELPDIDKLEENRGTINQQIMAKSHELPDIDKLEENRRTINRGEQIDRKSKMQSIAFCLSHRIDDYSFCKYAEK